MEQLIYHYNNSIQDLNDAIRSAEQIHTPTVLVAREAVVNASSDTWDVKISETKYKYKQIHIYNNSLKKVNIKDNVMIIHSKTGLQIDVIEELYNTLSNNNTLNSHYILASEPGRDESDIPTRVFISIENNSFYICYDTPYYSPFSCKISKHNLLHVLNKLIELHYSEEL